VREFRFGLSVRDAGSRAAWQDRARQAEALGFSTLVVPDHLVEALPPLVPLVSAADATERLRVGTFVLNNDFRHPVLVAREAAAVDLLSDGRLELGLGAGHMASEYREAGLRFDPASTRVQRLGEAVRIVRALLGGEAVTFEGRHYQVRGHSIHPRPVQRPTPPILIGGNGRQLLTLAAREADIVGFVGFSHRAGGADFDFDGFTDRGTAQRIALVREAAGERFERIELNGLLQRVVVTDRPGAAAEELAAEIGISVEDVLSSPYLLLGTVDSMVDTLRERRERLGISYWVTFERALDAMAPIIARLHGT
jgi:probable F420-dependent oxidoreductase